MATPRDILSFWFSERAKPRWFSSDRGFDQEIRERFEAASHQAQLGAFDEWRQSANDCLALVLLLDQFPRNLYQGQGKAFLGDGRALSVARQAIARGFDQRLGLDERAFFYMPFQHAEDPAAQDESIRLFTSLTDSFGDRAREYLRYAHLHRDVIRRFGRFPHRNQALGRVTTEAEAEFLKGPDSSF